MIRLPGALKITDHSSYADKIKNWTKIIKISVMLTLVVKIFGYQIQHIVFIWFTGL